MTICAYPPHHQGRMSRWSRKEATVKAVSLVLSSPAAERNLSRAGMALGSDR
jgi:hypothetical protein